MFRVGMRVVCIRNTPVGQERKYASGTQSTKIQIGAVYTVRDIDMRAVHKHGVACVRLVEFTAPERMTSVGLWEPGYPITAFRPVVERKTETDISIFRKMLNPSREHSNA